MINYNYFLKLHSPWKSFRPPIFIIGRWRQVSPISWESKSWSSSKREAPIFLWMVSSRKNAIFRAPDKRTEFCAKRPTWSTEMGSSITNGFPHSASARSTFSWRLRYHQKLAPAWWFKPWPFDPRTLEVTNNPCKKGHANSPSQKGHDLNHQVRVFVSQPSPQTSNNFLLGTVCFKKGQGNDFASSPVSPKKQTSIPKWCLIHFGRGEKSSKKKRWLGKWRENCVTWLLSTPKRNWSFSTWAMPLFGPIPNPRESTFISGAV